MTFDFPIGDIDLCFTVTDSSEKIISLDIYPSDDPLRELIDKKDLKIVEEALGKANKEMWQISINQQYHI